LFTQAGRSVQILGLGPSLESGVIMYCTASLSLSIYAHRMIGSNRLQSPLPRSSKLFPGRAPPALSTDINRLQALA
jgi:hypothetical protein